MIYYGEVLFVESSCKVCLSDRHTDCHTHTCAQRTGRCLNAAGMLILRMSRSQGAVLTELLQVLNGQAVAEQMKKGIQKGRTMSAGQNETVAVGPLGISRVVVHMISPKLVSHGCGTEGQARVTGICLLDRISGKHADRVYRLHFDIAHVDILLLFCKGIIHRIRQCSPS